MIPLQIFNPGKKRRVARKGFTVGCISTVEHEAIRHKATSQVSQSSFPKNPQVDDETIDFKCPPKRARTIQSINCLSVLA